MDKYTIDVAIPFNMIVDTEMGLLRLIRFEYRNDIFSYKSIENEEFMKMLLKCRIEENPLSAITNDISKTELDDMYHQFFDTRYDKILRLSPNTSIFDLTQLPNINNTIRYTIVFDDEEQKKIFELRGGKAFRTYVGSIFDEDIVNKNTTLYIKYISDLSKQTIDINGKNLYIADYYFNMVEIDDQCIPKLSKEDYGRYCENTFQFISLHRIDENKLNGGIDDE